MDESCSRDVARKRGEYVVRSLSLEDAFAAHPVHGEESWIDERRGPLDLRPQGVDRGCVLGEKLPGRKSVELKRVKSMEGGADDLLLKRL